MNVLKALTFLAATLGIGTSPITSADPADSFCDEPRAAAGWHYEVFASGLPRADNIAVGAEGEVYVSLEVGKGEGQVVRLRDGRRQIVAEGLDRPDGLALTPSHLYVTEEVWRGRLIRVDLADMSRTVLARLNKPEGVDILPDGSLVVAEDYPGGRLLRV
ncbi:MAG: hypothetical protein V3U18_06625, partial [Alphaproteobacteria bacterium]